MTKDGGSSDKGYEINGLPVWYHPYRFDALTGLGNIQRVNLRKRIREYLEFTATPNLEATTEKLYREQEYDGRRKAGGDYASIMHLRDIRRHHVENGGLVFDMANLGPHLEATWLNDVTLRNVFPYRTGIYVHVGETLEYEPSSPASLIEGFYITHTDQPVRGWLMTFVTNYPDWDQREQHTPGHTQTAFNRLFAFTIPEDADVAKLNYDELEIFGDKALAKKASLWHLARLATNAMLYLSRGTPDIQGSMSSFRVETAQTRRTEIYECGCDEVDWNIDWSNTTLVPGRWIIDEPGGDGAFVVTRWIPPKVVWPENKDTYLRGGGKVLQFRSK